jgi:phosphoglycerate kinase
MQIRSIKEAGDLKGKRVLVRVDWNVPMKNGKVEDTHRIEKTLQTLNYLKDAGAEVTLMTHLEPVTESIEPLREFVPQGMKLLDNLRINPGEKENDVEFAKELASHGDIFVNEAFSASHREHASIVGVPKLLPSYAGFEFVEEVENLSKAFNPEHPFLLIMGGAKIETKLPFIEKFLEKADELFIGGTLAPAAAEGELGKNPKIVFPLGDIRALDINRETVEMLKEKIEKAKFVLWNGPMGKYEEGYIHGTLDLVKVLAVSNDSNNKQIIIGGGDTLAAIEELDLFDKFTFVSSAGGAMLDFLATGTLPGIEALQ